MSNKKGKKKPAKKPVAKETVQEPLTAWGKVCKWFREFDFKHFIDEWLWLITLIVCALAIWLIFYTPDFSSCGKKDTSASDAYKPHYVVSESEIDLGDGNSMKITQLIDENAPSQTDAPEYLAPTYDYVKAPDGIQLTKPAAGERIAVLETNLGKLKLRLFPEQAPVACENFVGLIEKGYYDNNPFYAVIPNSAIYSGDPSGSGDKGSSIWNSDFKAESGRNLYNFYGAVGMANVDGSDHNDSRFYIVTNSSQRTTAEQMTYMGWPQWAADIYVERGGMWSLDDEYNNYFTADEEGYYHTVFAQVFEGMDVLAALDASDEDNDGDPDKEVYIVKAYMETYNG